jgi:hypothetical protein
VRIRLGTRSIPEWPAANGWKTAKTGFCGLAGNPRQNLFSDHLDQPLDEQMMLSWVAPNRFRRGASVDKALGDTQF